MKYLIVTMRKPDFDAAFVPAHYEFLDKLRSNGLLQQAGPFTDRSGGAYVVQASSLNDARTIAHQDPLFIHGCSDVSIREWDAK